MVKDICAFFLAGEDPSLWPSEWVVLVSICTSVAERENGSSGNSEQRCGHSWCLDVIGPPLLRFRDDGLWNRVLLYFIFKPAGWELKRMYFLDRL